MNTIELTIRQDSYVGTVMKWTSMFIFLLICGIGINTLHQQQMQKLLTSSNQLKQKSFLVSQMHDEMLSMSRTQLQILHASSDQQVKTYLRHLSELVSDHLIHYYQLKKIADDSDANLLMQFKIGFEQWHDFNENLLSYANIVSDSDFINTLKMVDMAFSQLDQDPEKTLLLISQLK